MARKKKKPVADPQTTRMAEALRDFLTTKNRTENVGHKEGDLENHGRMDGASKVPYEDTGQEGS